jgi:hypothetical protein
LVYAKPPVVASSGGAMSVNGNTENIKFENGLHVEGYDYGVGVAFHGHQVIRNGYFDCRYWNLSVSAPWGKGTMGLPDAPEGGSLTLENISFGDGYNGSGGKIYLSNVMHREQDGNEIIAANYRGFFEPFTMTIDGVEILHDCRLPDAIPFKAGEPYFPEHEKYIGLTNKQLHAQYGIWVGGKVLPDGTKIDPHPLITQGGGILVLPDVEPPPPEDEYIKVSTTGIVPTSQEGQYVETIIYRKSAE